MRACLGLHELVSCCGLCVWCRLRIDAVEGINYFHSIAAQNIYYNISQYHIISQYPVDNTRARTAALLCLALVLEQQLTRIGGGVEL